MRVNKVVRRLLLPSCAIVIAIVILSSRSVTPPDPETRSTRWSPAARGPAQAASHSAPMSVQTASEPVAAAPEADEITAVDPPASLGEPRAPEAELARLRTLLDQSGAAAGDALDRSSREIANELVTQLRAGTADVGATAVECRAAGCRVTLELASEADYVRLRNVVDGTALRSPVQRWPGSRILPPATHDSSGRLLVQIMLIRPDSTVNFGT
jgi:hypothetical protein